MTEEWKRKGYIESEEVDLPSEDRLREKPVAIIECPQDIPCDPCRESCPVGAILMEELNALPRVNFERCTGCSLCVQKCPGLAIFMVAYKEDSAEVTIPYEFTPLPRKSQYVDGLNRKGERVCRGEVIKILPRERSSGDTSLVTVKVPKEYINEVRNIRK